MRNLFCLLVSLCGVIASAQPFNWQWSVKDTSTLSTQDVMGFATDALGNSYVTGQFYGTASFGSLPPITSVGLSDVYVAKYDNQGVALWVASGGGSNFDGSYDLAIGPQGDVYITGYFQSPSVTFGSATLALQGGMDIFVARLSGTDGSFTWAERFGGPGNSNITEEGKAIACDGDGNIYVTGHFKFELDVPGLPLLEGCSQYFNSFLMKLDPDGNGIWSRKPECTQHYILGAAEGQCLAVSGAGDLYLGLRARGDTIHLETDTIPNVVPSGETYDGVVVKYDLDGNYQWSRRIGGYGYDEVQALQADADGHLYVAMHREDEYNLGIPNIEVSGNLGIYRNVILKYTTNGDLLWGTRIGNSTFDHDIEAMKLESAETLLVGGWHQGNFEIGGVTPNPGITGTYGIYLARFDSSSALTELYAERAQHPRGIRGIGLDEGDNIYIAGYFHDSLALPELPQMVAATSAMFLARSGDFNTSLGALYGASDGTGVYPIPSNGRFTIRNDRPFSEIRIVNDLGSVVLQRTLSPTGSCEVELLESGVYFCQLFDRGERIGTQRVVIER